MIDVTEGLDRHFVGGPIICTYVRRITTLLTLLTVGMSSFFAGGMVANADDEPTPPSASWPQFRGPTGQGMVVAGESVPVSWSETENIAWRAKVPGSGWSSPVIDGDELWVTTSTESGRSLRAISFDLTTGKLTRNIKVFDIDRAGTIHSKNGHASPTPILDGDRVYVHFGANGTACLTRSGRILWKRTLAYYHHHGSAGSPVLVDGVLVVICDGFTGPFYDKVTRPGVEQQDTARGQTQLLHPAGRVGRRKTAGDLSWWRPRVGVRSDRRSRAVELPV
ncbi:MAG: PQQ-binding-like beta-propeller repeat protein [Planctomycetota bacterium]|nr:PQQ-binding-like beta-propeller repeat protein [Planctomycetota bacterium]